MKLEGNKFYLVNTGKDKWITTNQNEAVEKLMNKFREDEGLNPEKTGIYEAVISDVKRWEIRQIPWSQVVARIIRGG